MEEIEGFHLSPRSSPQRRYSRRNSHDNGRRRGEMCHGFDRHCGDGRFGNGGSVSKKKISVIAYTLAENDFIEIITKIGLFLLRKKLFFRFRKTATYK